MPDEHPPQRPSNGSLPTPSRFVSEQGNYRVTPIISSYGDVNFFEQSFERTLQQRSEEPGTTGLPSNHTLPELRRIAIPVVETLVTPPLPEMPEQSLTPLHLSPSSYTPPLQSPPTVRLADAASSVPRGGQHGRRRDAQEKNRIAAMKSRQKKKREWERLMAENQELRERVQQLETELLQSRGTLGRPV